MENTNKSFILMIIPGMGSSNVLTDVWYFYLKQQLESYYKDCIIILENMPDPINCQEKLWIPFIKKQINEKKSKYPNHNVYCVGHSTGAIAIMRLLENFELDGAVLCGGYTSDLNDKREEFSGYFPKINKELNTVERDWNWENIKKNTKWLVNILSEDDKYVPNKESLEISSKLNIPLLKSVNDESGLLNKEGFTMYFKKEDYKGHFIISQFPELVEFLRQRIDNDLLSK